MLKRGIALILAAVLMLGMLPAAQAAEGENKETMQTRQSEMEAIIEKQIRAFADSIDQPNADERRHGP